MQQHIIEKDKVNMKDFLNEEIRLVSISSAIIRNAEIILFFDNVKNILKRKNIETNK